MYNKISQLLITPGAKSSTTSDIFVAQPDSNKETLVGKVFALIEIESKKVSDLKIINFLTENLNNNYYQNEKMILRERVKSVKIEHIFESALAKTNKNFTELLRSEKIKFDPKSINATIGVIYENNLHFANIGKNKAYLIYKKPLSVIRKINKTQNENNDNGGYSITNIIKHSESTEEKKKPLIPAKLFSSVVSGSIPVDGYFVFTNEALPEYLSAKQLTEIVTTLPPASAAELIKNSLSKINYYVSFLSIIIKNTQGHEKEDVAKEKMPDTAAESVSNLNTMEDETEKLLSPGGLISIKKWSGMIGSLFFKEKIKKESSAKKIKKESGAGLLKDKIFFRKQASPLFLTKIFNTIKYFFIYIFKAVFYAFKIITSREKLEEILAKIKFLPSLIKIKIQKSINWTKGLSRKNQILMAVSLVLLIVFFQNVFMQNKKNQKVKEEELYVNLVKPIEQKQNQVEASLLYGNEGGAKELLREIEILITELPKDTDEQIEIYKKFDTKHNEQLVKIRHVTKIENSKLLADLSKLNSQANPINIAFSSDGGKIFAGDSGQKTIYSLELFGNLATAITSTDNKIKDLKYPTADKGDSLYYFNNNSIVELNTKTGEIKILDIDLPIGPPEIVAAGEFNKRLYLLNKKDNQIYRFNKRPSGFTDTAKWLTDEADFSNASSIAIDGHIYVLKEDGAITKYLKGEEQEFKMDSAEPIIEKATKLFISPEAKYIYIFEPANQRLVVFDGTGNFLMQYRGDQFTKLKDFLVDEKNKLIYFLNDASIYEVPATHFNNQ